MKDLSEVPSVEVQFRLASAWQARGNMAAAKSGFEQVLRLDPGHASAHSKLGEVMLERGMLKEALRHFARALELDPHNADLRFRRGYLDKLLRSSRSMASDPGYARSAPDRIIPDQPQGKINLNRQRRFHGHRSGWNGALRTLEAVHNSQGVWFDGFVEENFARRHWREGKRDARILQRLRDSGAFEQLATSEEQGITPYQKPWVGCMHNPQGMPGWFRFEEAPQTLFKKAIWQQSFEHCRGLFTFSEYHANWLRENTGKPVSALVLPTEIPERQFDFGSFLANPRRKIVQIGWWLRRQSAIYELPLARNNPMNYEKLRLVPMFFDNAEAYLEKLIKKETEILGLTIAEAFAKNTREVMHLPNSEYDDLLSRNLAFVYLFDANANNAVIECIARATPLLVNPLPAVVEYLGADYPLYFSDLAEAAEKSLDVKLLEQAHGYLKTCPTRARLSYDVFLQSFTSSEVYRAL